MNDIAAITKPARIIRIKEVQSMIGIGRSTIYDWINPKSPRFDQTFPAPFKLGGASVGWLLEEVCEWIQARSKAGRTEL